MLIRSRIVAPVSREAIEDGAVLIDGNRISALGRWKDLSTAGGPVVDLGNSILLPGLVNAHCHLDYTDMAGFLPPMRFPNWVMGIISCKAEWSYSEYAQSWIRGARMLARTGTTTVADIEAVPELLPEVWTATPLRVASFLEITCVRRHRESREIVHEAADRMRSLAPPRGFVGLSPHALYSTSPPLLELIGEEGRRENWRMTMHIAESPEEYEMYVDRSGGLFDWLGRQRDMSDCGHGTPVRQLQRCGLLGENLLAVHANYLQPADVKLLAQSGASVVHCPRSHSYFGYDPFPYKKLAAAGVNLCLGTDSLASVNRVHGNKPELNLFAEMALFSLKNPGVPPWDIIKMATVNGAKALGLTGRVGELSPGAFADWIAIPHPGGKTDIGEAILNHWQDVSASMIDGLWVVEPSIAG
jgi:cytosine/adenosine deaminase-related metal-dependent hydrolase